ncbi:MAG: leucine-rich repeat domain-containing protein [Ruminococcus sp.]|nr:leucine-rich repeat domain-containing protein [Ruminococcus sp.]
MKMTKCINEHYYNSDKFSSCPYCEKEAAAARKAAEENTAPAAPENVQSPPEEIISAPAVQEEHKAKKVHVRKVSHGSKTVPVKDKEKETSAEDEAPAPEKEHGKVLKKPSASADDARRVAPVLHRKISVIPEPAEPHWAKADSEGNVFDYGKTAPPPVSIVRPDGTVGYAPPPVIVPEVPADDSDIIGFDEDELLELQLEASSPDPVSDDNNMFIDKNGTLVKYIGTTETILIPDRVRTIGKYAFRSNETVKKIIMGSSVTLVDKFAFAHCFNLEEVVFSPSLETIADNAFLKCLSLRHLDLPASLTKIGKGAFARCGSLEELKIPEKIQKINDLSFYSCKSLRKVELPISAEVIGNAAFSECYSLKDIHMEFVTLIGESAFAWCRSLEKISLPASLKTISGWSFYGCQNLTDMVISINTRDIREDAFTGCENLYNVDILEMVNDRLPPEDTKKAYRQMVRVFRRFNTKRAEKIAREHGISMLFMR